MEWAYPPTAMKLVLVGGVPSITNICRSVPSLDLQSHVLSIKWVATVSQFLTYTFLLLQYFENEVLGSYIVLGDYCPFEDALSVSFFAISCYGIVGKFGDLVHVSGWGSPKLKISDALVVKISCKLFLHSIKCHRHNYTSFTDPFNRRNVQTFPEIQ